MKGAHATTFKDRIKRAIKAFNGKPLSSITYGIEVKQCSDCERNKSSIYDAVFYICDRKACYGVDCHNSKCAHTSDVRHAVNFSNENGSEPYFEKL